MATSCQLSKLVRCYSTYYVHTPTLRRARASPFCSITQASQAARPMRDAPSNFEASWPLLPSFQRWTDITTRANGGVQFSLVRQNCYEVRSTTWCINFLLCCRGERELSPSEKIINNAKLLGARWVAEVPRVTAKTRCNVSVCLFADSSLEKRGGCKAQ